MKRSTFILDISQRPHWLFVELQSRYGSTAKSQSTGCVDGDFAIEPLWWYFGSNSVYSKTALFLGFFGYLRYAFLYCYVVKY